MSHNLLSDRYYLLLSLLYNAVHYFVRRQRRDTLLAYARAFTVYQGDHSTCELRDSRLWMKCRCETNYLRRTCRDTDAAVLEVRHRPGSQLVTNVDDMDSAQAARLGSVSSVKCQSGCSFTVLHCTLLSSVDGLSTSSGGDIQSHYSSLLL